MLHGSRMVQLLCKLITRQIDQFASSFKSLLSDLLNGPSARNDPRVPNRFDLCGEILWRLRQSGC
jgi:hypothetical protein